MPKTYVIRLSEEEILFLIQHIAAVEEGYQVGAEEGLSVNKELKECAATLRKLRAIYWEKVVPLKKLDRVNNEDNSIL